MGEQAGKVSSVQVPLNRTEPVPEPDWRVSQQCFELWLVAGKVFEVFRMLQGKSQGFQSMIKTQQMNGGWHLPGRAEDRQSVGGRAQADVPDDKLTGVALEPLRQLELEDVEGLRLGDRSDHRVKSLSVGK